MNGQDRVSPYNVNTIWSRKVMKTSSSPNSHHKNCLADSKENFWRDLRSENVDQILNLLLVCPTDDVYVRKESERRLERRKQEQENTNKQQSVGT